jgi:16S rRNA (guanine966-N2)-methyltransferase
VTRIIAGAARGRRLAVPGSGTRPTTDRVRESMFASLDHLMGGFARARVLDLYAGSGALGLEAVSRGAARAVLVERDRRSAGIARANAEVVDAAALEEGRIRVVAVPVSAHLGGPAEPYDLVLADPPYALGRAELEAVLTGLLDGWLAPDAVLMVERARAGGEFAWPTGIQRVREATYGTTTLWYGHRAPEGEDT